MKKLLMVLVALSLVSTAAFANSNAEADSDKTTLSIFIGESMPDYPEGGTIVGDRISEIANVDYEFEFLVGELATRTGIMLASGDYPDIINARGEEDQFKAAGAYIPLNDLIEEHAPNIKKLFGETNLNACKEEDGNIYVLPDLPPYGVRPYTDAEKGWWIQKAILKEAGWPKVRKFEDYWKLIEDYKAKYPTINGQPTIGFMGLTYDWYRDYLYGAGQLLDGKHSDNPLIELNDEGKWTVEGITGRDFEKKYFKHMNEMFNKGLIDPESFVADLDQYKAKIASGRVLGIYDEYWIMNASQEILKAEHPERIFVCLPLTWDGGSEQYLYPQGLATGLGTGISVSCEDPVAAIKFLDTVAREDIMILSSWGREGEEYTDNGDGTFTMTPEQADKFDEAGDWFFQVYGGKYFFEFLPTAQGTYSNGMPTRFGWSKDLFRQTKTETELEVLDAYGWDTFNDEWSAANNERAFYSPLYSIRATSGSDDDLNNTRIYDLRTKYVPLLMTAEEGKFNEIWDEWMSQVTPEMLDMHHAFYQRAINRRLAAYGIDNE